MVGSPAIWWIRRDLRLADNQALSAAMAHANDVVPLFILDPRLLNSPYVGSRRLAFLFAGLRALNNDLHEIGSRLIVRKGDPVEVLLALINEIGATAVFAEQDFSPYARRRDARADATLPLRLTGGLTVHPPDFVLKKDGQPYTVFTPFSKAWKALPRPNGTDLLGQPVSLNTPTGLASLSVPDEPALADEPPFPTAESAGLRRLVNFTGGSMPAIYQYGERRNRPDIEGTSSLSPYLRLGMISAGQAAAAAGQAIDLAPDELSRKSAEIWLNELIWREFYLSILYHFPYVRRQNFRSQYDAIQWDNDPQAFAGLVPGAYRLSDC